jgi:hypothetical protein
MTDHPDLWRSGARDSYGDGIVMATLVAADRTVQRT